MLTVPKLSDTFVYPLYTGTVPVGYSPSRSIMTYPICHTKTQFPLGVAFYLFDQPEQQTAFSAVFTPPLLGFQVSLFPKILDRPLHRRPGERQFSGNGADGRPALMKCIRPVREINIDRFSPVGEILVIIDLLQFPQVYQPPFVSRYGE